MSSCLATARNPLNLDSLMSLRVEYSLIFLICQFSVTRMRIGCIPLNRLLMNFVIFIEIYKTTTLENSITTATNYKKGCMAFKIWPASGLSLGWSLRQFRIICFSGCPLSSCDMSLARRSISGCVRIPMTPQDGLL